MNYNNYNNPYNQYPYTAYGNNGYQQPQQYQQQNMVYQPQPNYNQQQVVQTQQYLPLTFTNGVVGAKSFIVNPSQTIYMLDSDTDKYLFIKSADKDGRYKIIARPLGEPIDIDSIGKDTNAHPISTDRFIMKEDLKNFPTFEDFSKLEVKFDNALDRLTRQIDRLNNRTNNSNNNNNKEKKEND